MAKIDAIQAEVDDITDNLGMPIDKGIKRAVVALRFLGFPTSGSCEGHKEGFYYPLVEIYADEPAGADNKKEHDMQWKKANKPYQKQLTKLLGDYYRNKKTDKEPRLKMVNIGVFGGFRLQSVPELDNGDGYDDARQLRFRREMNDFAEYLLRYNPT